MYILILSKAPEVHQQCFIEDQHKQKDNITCTKAKWQESINNVRQSSSTHNTKFKFMADKNLFWIRAEHKSKTTDSKCQVSVKQTWVSIVFGLPTCAAFKSSIFLPSLSAMSALEHWGNTYNMLKLMLYLQLYIPKCNLHFLFRLLPNHTSNIFIKKKNNAVADKSHGHESQGPFI